MEIRYATISKTDRRHNNEDAFKAIDISVTWKDGSKHQRAYRNGLLAYIQEVPDMEMYHEDMNVDSGDYRWENYYNK